MGFFGKKKSKEQIEKEERRTEMLKYAQQVRGINMPEIRRIPRISSREYNIYKRSERQKPHWYERLAGTCGKVLSVQPDKGMKENLEAAINFTNMRIKPSDCMATFVLSIIFFTIVGVAFIFSGPMETTRIVIGLVIPVAGAAVGYYLMIYPMSMVKQLRMQASSEVVLAVLYMVVSMRISPNLEEALRFAAANVTGPLAWDMRRMLWDIEMRKYVSAADAFDYYIDKWKPENEEFSEALRLIRDSETQISEKGRAILDQALDVILDGTKTRMKHYAQELSTPVMIIHMMGIILPVMGTIMAPLAAIFLSGMIRPEHFIIGYDIALPIMIIAFMNSTLNKRPVTFSQVDISNHPDLARDGCFMMGRKSVPVWSVSLLVFLAIGILPIYFFAANPGLLLSGQATGEGCTLLGSYTENCSFLSTFMSLLITLTIAATIASYYYLANFQKIKVQDSIQKTESQFELALFQLGNRISGGTPTEVAIEDSIQEIRDLEISGLFERTLMNIRNLGMTFDQALFDKKYGALNYYPSKLIRNIMYAVIDTARKGVSYASDTMLRISKYLKNIKETQEYIRELLSETSSSMKFQAYFLTPMITGMIVSMADIITQVLVQLGKYLEGMGIGQGNDLSGFQGLSSMLGDMNAAISPALFQLIVGIYVIEVIIILGMFLTKISYGENKIIQHHMTSKMLLIGIVIYFIIAMVSSSIFGDLIRSALSGLGVS